MNASRQIPLRATLLVLAVAAPGAAMAAEGARDESEARQEARRIEAEGRRLQMQGQRQMQNDLRSQNEALRGQEDSIRRLEEARRRLEESSREVAELSTQMGRDYSYSFSTSGSAPRAVIGIQMRPSEGAEGAVVNNVSPGGAAEVAGLKAGDVITHVAGYDVSKDSDPQRAVVEKMRGVEPDAKVPVTVLRDGKKMNFELTARAAPVPSPQMLPYPMVGGRTGADPLRIEMRNMVDNLRMLPPGSVSLVGGPTGAGSGARIDPIVDRQMFMLADANRLGGLELATVSDRLGDYFGVDSGVLVVRAGADAPFGLQDGDVILAIDGREPNNAQHVGRILRSYQPGETVKLRVQRDRKARDLEGALPAR